MNVDNQQIVQLRVDNGWTQQHLADACGVSLRTIQRVEKEGIASVETVAALCSVFEIERQHIVAEPNEKNATRRGPADTNQSPRPVWLEALPMLLTLIIGMAIGISLTLWLTGR